MEQVPIRSASVIRSLVDLINYHDNRSPLRSLGLDWRSILSLDARHFEKNRIPLVTFQGLKVEMENCNLQDQ